MMSRQSFIPYRTRKIGEIYGHSSRNYGGIYLVPSCACANGWPKMVFSSSCGPIMAPVKYAILALSSL